MVGQNCAGAVNLKLALAARLPMRIPVHILNWTLGSFATSMGGPTTSLAKHLFYESRARKDEN